MLAKIAYNGTLFIVSVVKCEFHNVSLYFLSLIDNDIFSLISNLHRQKAKVKFIFVRNPIVNQGCVLLARGIFCSALC